MKRHNTSESEVESIAFITQLETAANIARLILHDGLEPALDAPCVDLGIHHRDGHWTPRAAYKALIDEIVAVSP